MWTAKHEDGTTGHRLKTFPKLRSVIVLFYPGRDAQLGLPTLAAQTLAISPTTHLQDLWVALELHVEIQLQPIVIDPDLADGVGNVGVALGHEIGCVQHPITHGRISSTHH